MVRAGGVPAPPLDHQAQILQNQFWRQRVTLIAGGLVATSLATVQAAMGGGKVYLAVPQAGLTGLLAGLTVLVRSRRAQHGYLSARLKAERIKSEFFLFLTQAAPYASGDRVTRLLQEVGDIEAAEGIGSASEARSCCGSTRRNGSRISWGSTPDGSSTSTGRPARGCSSPPRSSASRPPPARWHGTTVGWAKGWAAAAAILAAVATAITAYLALYAFDQQSKIYGDAVRAVRAASRLAPDPDAPDDPDLDAHVAGLVNGVEQAMRQEQSQSSQLTSQMQAGDQKGG